MQSNRARAARARRLRGGGAHCFSIGLGLRHSALRIDGAALPVAQRSRFIDCRLQLGCDWVGGVSTGESNVLSSTSADPGTSIASSAGSANISSSASVPSFNAVAALISTRVRDIAAPAGPPSCRLERDAVFSSFNVTIRDDHVSILATAFANRPPQLSLVSRSAPSTELFSESAMPLTAPCAAPRCE